MSAAAEGDWGFGVFCVMQCEGGTGMIEMGRIETDSNGCIRSYLLTLRSDGNGVKWARAACY